MDFRDVAKLVQDRPFTNLDFIDLFCGEHLGSGVSRDVYVYQIDPRWVIKIETPDSEGDNWAEWRVWNTVKYTTDGTKDWFAPCDWISRAGRVMLQKRTKPIETKEKKIPEKIPAFFTDVKDSNFGWIGNQLVCHDYSHCIERFGYFALKPNKLQKFTR